MKHLIGFLLSLALAASVHGEVHIFVESSNSVALLKYECTAGELVRAFALNVSVDRGQIVGISNFFRGPSTAGATGYGIFPASLRDQNLIGTGTNVNWNFSGYTPEADVTDAPTDTLPGLNSSGLTLEFGGLWDPNVPAAIPLPRGTLCTLTLSQPAYVSIAPNVTRGGVVSAFAENQLSLTFSGGLIAPSVISATLVNGTMNILFSGGELQTAADINGPWTDTGDLSGSYIEPIGTNQIRFYRVHSP